MSYAAYRKSSTWIRMALKVDGKHRNNSTHSCLALESKWKLRKSSMLSIEGRHRVVLDSLPNLNLISINIQCILLPVCCEVFSFFFIIISMSLCVLFPCGWNKKYVFVQHQIWIDFHTIHVRIVQPFVCSMPNMIWFSSFHSMEISVSSYRQREKAKMNRKMHERRTWMWVDGVIKIDIGMCARGDMAITRKLVVYLNNSPFIVLQPVNRYHRKNLFHSFVFDYIVT